MTVRIGMTNQQGGVAKTTNTINLAGALAARDLDVLAVDADPQGYLTHRLGFKEAYKKDSPTFFTAMNEPNETDPADIIVEHAEFDVLPSNIDMFRLEQDLIASGWLPRKRLQMVFDKLPEYDALVVDAPPSLGPINDNVILATEHILVPVQAEDTSQLAVEHLLRQLDTLEDRYQTSISIDGILISNVEYPLDNEQREMLDWFERTFEGRCPVWEVRNRAAIKRSIKYEGSIFGADAEATDMTEVYADIAASVMGEREGDA